MTSALASRPVPAAGNREWAISGVRPVTLLIASSIVLVTAILIFTGLAAGHLREQALKATEGELSRLNVVVAEHSRRSIGHIDQALQHIALGIQARGIRTPADYAEQMAGDPTRTALEVELANFANLDEIVLIGADGRRINASRDATGPADLSSRDYFRDLKMHSTQALAIGAAIAAGGDAGTWSIPIARRIAGPGGEFLGAVATSVKATEFTDFFRTVGVAADTAVTLQRRDGTVLARYPAKPDEIGRVSPDASFKQVLMAGDAGTFRAAAGSEGEWEIKSFRALNGYPVVTLMTLPGEKVLADWAQQAVLLGAFAVAGAIGIGLMVHLIARQFRVHAALVSVQAEKIEMEHGRLVAEAELLKKERLSVLGQLTATVAHELRNPLSAIRNTLFSVREMTATSGIKLDRPIARMERSIERCDRIITDLLEYTKTRDLRCEPVGFDRWLDDVLSDQNMPAEIVLERHLGAAGAVTPIDAERVRRVVINLVENSVQALAEIPAAGPDKQRRDKKVTVRTSANRDLLILTIEDTGPGIKPENLARIFEPLFSTKSFGTGLGLATVRQIVTEHGGSIDIDSEVGQGTRVTVHLPLVQEERAAA